jgi:hypothetical protein
MLLHSHGFEAGCYNWYYVVFMGFIFFADALKANTVAQEVCEQQKSTTATKAKVKVAPLPLLKPDICVVNRFVCDVHVHVHVHVHVLASVQCAICAISMHLCWHLCMYMCWHLCNEQV